MERTNNPFYYYYETIDLHGLDALTALIKVNEFINDNIKLKKYGIIIVENKFMNLNREKEPGFTQLFIFFTSIFYFITYKGFFFFS